MPAFMRGPPLFGFSGGNVGLADAAELLHERGGEDLPGDAAGGFEDAFLPG